MDQTYADCFAALERAIAAKKTIVRQDLREVLVAIGRLILDENEAAAEPELARLAAVRDQGQERFAQALREELTMAVTEHVRSCDPRYLGNPQYDLVYAIEARERLEARLETAERLGLPAEDALLGAVARADALLQPLLERNQG